MKMVFFAGHNRSFFIFTMLICIVLLAGCAFPGFATATLTPTLEPTQTPTITNTPEPTATSTPSETPTPSITPTPAIPWVVTLGTFYEDKCPLAYDGDHLIVAVGCQDIKIDNFPIPRGQQVWFSIYIPGNESTYTDSSSEGWIKLEAGEYSEVDARGRQFACSPPAFGEFVCIVKIISPTGLIPLYMTIQAALE